jgi:hypothetical protein
MGAMRIIIGSDWTVLCSFSFFSNALKKVHRFKTLIVYSIDRRFLSNFFRQCREDIDNAIAVFEWVGVDSV